MAAEAEAEPRLPPAPAGSRVRRSGDPGDTPPPAGGPGRGLAALRPPRHRPTGHAPHPLAVRRLPADLGPQPFPRGPLVRRHGRQGRRVADRGEVRLPQPAPQGGHVDAGDDPGDRPEPLAGPAHQVVPLLLVRRGRRVPPGRHRHRRPGRVQPVRVDGQVGSFVRAAAYRAKARAYRRWTGVMQISAAAMASRGARRPAARSKTSRSRSAM